MKHIKIIDSLHLDDEGLRARMKNGKLQQVHLRQGDLDGACAVYSTVMILIMLGVVKHSDVRFGGNEYDKRYGIERFKKEFFELKGLHREGNYFSHEKKDNIKDMLQRSFSRQVSSESIKGNSKEIIEVIEQHINSNQPLLISIAYKGGGEHALVVIGIEYNNNIPSKILCLDPGYSSPSYSYWNSIIDLKEYTGKYNFRYLANNEKYQFVQLQDVLSINKK